jgi:hypothetical protein
MKLPARPLTAALLLACATLLGAAPGASCAQADSHARVVMARATATGQVTAVDLATRTITLRDPAGVEHAYPVDPEVPGLDAVKPGDTIRVDYHVSVAVALRKGGDGIRKQVEDEASMRPSPDAPGITAGRRTTIVTNVISVDTAKHTVRLQGPQGRVDDFEVQDPRALADVKPGDQVVAVVYEELAFGLVPVKP